MANLVAAVLQTNGLHVEKLGGRVMAPDEEAETARLIITSADSEGAPNQRDGRPGNR